LYFGDDSVFLTLIQTQKGKFCTHQYVHFSPLEFSTIVAHNLPFARIAFAVLVLQHVEAFMGVLLLASCSPSLPSSLYSSSLLPVIVAD
jgi:hypothetical protein